MLIHRQLTQAEAARLHEELKTTPNILGYTVKELTRFPDVLVAEIEGDFAGVCISKDLRFGWTDIAVLYVLPAFRGRGIARELYTAAWQRAQQRGRHIFTLSRSPEVIHLMEQFGMELSRSMWRAPLAFHLHMNRHMMSWYRIKEAMRKSKQIPGSAPLLGGAKRHTPDLPDATDPEG
jgi:GNAT superfamily N-acetyltransferase